MENLINRHWLKIIILIVVLILGYYFIVQLPAKQKLEKESQQKIIEQAKINAQNSRAMKAEQCIETVETKAVDNFYNECVSNPAVGGSPEKCDTSNKQQAIRYIESQSAISFGVWQINKKLTADRNLCADLYGN
jgi:hypothetical protein